MEPKIRKNKCPDCGGELVLKDGFAECVNCDFNVKDRREEAELEYSEWVQS